MEWEIIILLVIASPFVLYHVMRNGIGRLKKSIMERRRKNEITVG